jgi:hypothetical protein
VIGAAVVAAFLTIRDPSSDMTKILVGGWGTALGNVIGFYFGARSSAGLAVPPRHKPLPVTVEDGLPPTVAERVADAVRQVG